MVGDPIGDMIIRIKNAGMAGKDSVTIPFSNIKFEIANILKNEGYLKAVEVLGKDKSPVVKKLELGIAYLEKPALSAGRSKSKVQDVLRVSKLSKRVYVSLNDLGAMRKTRGISLVSTTKGILTGKSAKEKGVGGELLFRIW